MLACVCVHTELRCAPSLSTLFFEMRSLTELGVCLSVTLSIEVLCVHYHAQLLHGRWGPTLRCYMCALLCLAFTRALGPTLQSSQLWGSTLPSELYPQPEGQVLEQNFFLFF